MRYPTLTEMGIQRFDDITHYTLRQDGKNRDLLKVFYKREKGSLLPKRKTFRFGRASTMRNDIEVYDISPFVLAAVKEIESIVDGKSMKVDKTQLLLQRIEELEHDLKAATEDLKSMVNALND